MKRLFKFALAAGLFALVAAAGAYLTLTWVVRGEETVAVPDLREKELVTVLEILTDLGLNAKVRELEYHPSVPKSQVIFQDPAAGEEVKKGRDVRIVISKGTQTVYMPNLANRPARQADIVLEENGLCRGSLSQAYSEAHEPGSVIAQEPPPGTIVSRDTCVNLLVSLGRRPRALPMPDLTGLGLDEALEQIEKLKLFAGDVSSESAPGKPRNTVLSQSPPSGRRVEEGGRVDLVVNRGAGTEAAKGEEEAGKVLFRHRTGPGFLNRHIRAELTGYGPPLVFFDDYVKPGRELWFVLPRQGGARVTIYENGERVREKGWAAGRPFLALTAAITF